MRKSLVSIAIATSVALATPWLAAAAPTVGAPAPAFTGTDTHGQKRSLADAKGKYVVLEWHNQGCPFVKKHYDTGNMQKLQKELTAQGVVWYSVISSAPGKQGHVTATEEDAYLKEHNATPTAVIVDEDGTIGRLYGAKTTPHMFVIDDKGTLVYAGAIDDKPTPDKSDVEGATSYVLAAYKESKAGKPVTVATTAPYGCSVKYETP
jgi:peroxiredoxin